MPTVSVRTRLRLVAAVMLVVSAAAGCRVYRSSLPTQTPVGPVAVVGPLLPGQSVDVFTTARPTFAATVNDFLVRRPSPVQPIEFPHNIHVGKQIACTEYCHEGVSTQAVAGLPSVRTCMLCHNAIATDRPRIQQITAMRDRGEDLAWQRVFDFPAASHVRFNHAPHIRAEVACATCHGAIAEQTVAQRNVTLTMGVCVGCHREKQASVDCQACHF